MSGVTIPGWLFAVLLGLAVVAVLDRLLMPSVRWFFRRRVNRVIEELNARLPIRLQPFKLTKRRVLIDRLVYDPHIAEVVEQFAREEQLPPAVVQARVERYAREIVPAFNAYFYFRFGYWLARKIAHKLYRVRLGWADEEALAAVETDATLVFVMNHRSNMDYILVSLLTAERTALSYAVGEWARIWPLHTLIRAMGAYFVRRDSGNVLYRRVLERYVQMATESGVTQALFPEGGLSRDGRLREPKLGILDYMLRGFDPEGERDLVLIPVGLNYDRVFEDRNLLKRQDEQYSRPGRLEAMRSVGGFILHNLGLMVRQKWFRFGYACVNFGKPLSLRGWLAENSLDLRNLDRAKRFHYVEELARRLMKDVGDVIPVLPVALVSWVLLAEEGGEPLSSFGLKARVHRLLVQLEESGARLYLPRHDRDYAVSVGLRMLTLRHLVKDDDGLYTVTEEGRGLLEYYANSIRHLVDRATPPPW